MTTHECYDSFLDQELEKRVTEHHFQVDDGSPVITTTVAHYCDQCFRTTCHNCFCIHWPDLTKHRHDKLNWRIQRWTVLGEGHGRGRTWHIPAGTPHPTFGKSVRDLVQFPVRCLDCGAEGILQVEPILGNIFHAGGFCLHQLLGAKRYSTLLDTPDPQETARISREIRARYHPQSIAFGYVRASGTDRDEGALEPQLRRLRQYGLPSNLILADDETATAATRPGWTELLGLAQPGDTIVVSGQDRFSSRFEEGIAIQADLTRRGIWIVAIEEDLDTRDGSPGAQYYRRILLAHGDYQEQSASELIKDGSQETKRQGRGPGRPPALDGEGIAEARRLYAGNGSIRRTARTLGVAADTVKKAVGLD